ncbi:hypothetical protein PWT90_09002 [Aphanocladium album]|nr:hypothetical protein PWT90_09002 [Aphanocladium album]
MAEAIKSALPSHLRPAAAGAGEENNGFEKRHHGKTRSHMVSSPPLCFDASSPLTALAAAVLPPPFPPPCYGRLPPCPRMASSRNASYLD